jgi:DNA-binding transcriptional LysR family regulator
MSDSHTFRLLQYVKTSAETLNFTKAAEKLFVAQSSVSHSIGKLEDEIGVLIFERIRNHLRLTPAGRIVVAYATKTLDNWGQTQAMALAVQENRVPPLRLGFSSFVNAKLLEKFREYYSSIFTEGQIQLISGDPFLNLQRLDTQALDCAVLPLPVDTERYLVQSIAESPLVVCMRCDDPLANYAQLDIHEIADRITVFRDPEDHPAAHSRLAELFSEVGIPIHVACTARTPAEIQWLVKERYGLALIDQLLPLEAGLITRPIAGIDWTADTAFVRVCDTDHVALPFVEEFFREMHTSPRRKPSRRQQPLPEQMRLLA